MLVLYDGQCCPSLMLVLSCIVLFGLDVFLVLSGRSWWDGSARATWRKGSDGKE